MYSIGSGDIKSVMVVNKETKSYKEFLMKFFGIKHIIYNALNSPIDWLRIGAILESRFYKTLSSEWYEQVKVQCKEQDVLTVSLDFSKLENGEVIDFIELKSVNFQKFLDIQEISQEEVKKKFKEYYNQIQSQLYATGLKEASLVFLVVYNYDDLDNLTREIKPNEILEIRIKRDEKTIEKIKKELVFYQNCKDYLGGKNEKCITEE